VKKLMDVFGNSRQPEVPPVPEPSAVDNRKKWLPWVIGVAAFVLGVAVGGIGGQNPTSSPEYTTIQAQLQSEQERTSQLTDDVDAARADIEAAAAEAEARLAGQAAQLDQRSAELDQRATDLAAQEQALRAAEQEVSAPAPAPAPAPVAVPPAPSSVSYENCTAARNAGAAPVRAGEPGYGRHLDRDGDGIGCE
jgi:Tfp pilus assembly protein FimV